jgi:hypothetical protein
VAGDRIGIERKGFRTSSGVAGYDEVGLAADGVSRNLILLIVGFLTLSNRSRASRNSPICQARSSDKAAQKGLDFLCKRSVTVEERPKTKGQAA